MEKPRSRRPWHSPRAAKPDSKVGGVQIGIHVPYSFHGMSGTADDILADMPELGVNAAELRLQPVEAFLGAPGVVIQAATVPGAPPAPRNRVDLPLVVIGSGLPQIVGLAGRSKSYDERLFDFPNDAVSALQLPVSKQVRFADDAPDEVLRVTETGRCKGSDSAFGARAGSELLPGPLRSPHSS